MLFIEIFVALNKEFGFKASSKCKAFANMTILHRCTVVAANISELKRDHIILLTISFINYYRLLNHLKKVPIHIFAYNAYLFGSTRRF